MSKIMSGANEIGDSDNTTMALTINVSIDKKYRTIIKTIITAVAAAN